MLFCVTGFLFLFSVGHICMHVVHFISDEIILAYICL